MILLKTEWKGQDNSRGHFHLKLYGMCRFSGCQFSAQIPEQGIRIDKRFLKQVMTICSRTIGYCFPWCFLEIVVICNSETGYRNANLLPEQVVHNLKNGHLSTCYIQMPPHPPPPGEGQFKETIRKRTRKQSEEGQGKQHHMT